MKYAPIILFVYNRPWHTRKTVEALQKNELAAESDLFIFADGPTADASNECLENISEVRKYIHTITGFQSVQIDEASQNIGCADSIIRGVGKVIEKHGKVIVVEDDIVAHPFFLRFMNDALNTYENDKRIFCISATMERFEIPANYPYDVFLTYRTGSWGWATWRAQWNTCNWDIESYPIIKHPSKRKIKLFCRGGDDLWPMLNAQLLRKIDSWAIRYCYNMHELNKMCLRPVKSLVSNIGMDKSGTHCGDAEVPLLPLYDDIKAEDFVFPHEVKVDREITRRIQNIFMQPVPKVKLTKRLKRFIKRVLASLHLWAAKS